MTVAQLAAAQRLYMTIGKDMARTSTRVANARAFVAEWQSQLPAKIHADCQTARVSLKNATFLVRPPKKEADKGRWSDHCYKVLPDLEQGGPIMVHRQRERIIFITHRKKTMNHHR